MVIILTYWATFQKAPKKQPKWLLYVGEAYAHQSWTQDLQGENHDECSLFCHVLQSRDMGGHLRKDGYYTEKQRAKTVGAY